MDEVYNCVNNIRPLFTKDYFKQKANPHNFKNMQLLELSKYRPKTYGLNTALL